LARPPGQAALGRSHDIYASNEEMIEKLHQNGNGICVT
jgi:hypothetical protein